MKKKNYKVPYDDKGNLLSYEPLWGSAEFKDPTVWEDTLVIENYERGRSSAIFIACSLDTQKRYPIFMSNFIEMIPLMVNGVITGKFSEVKKGANFGIEIIREEGDKNESDML